MSLTDELLSYFVGKASSCDPELIVFTPRERDTEKSHLWREEGKQGK